MYLDFYLFSNAIFLMFGRTCQNLECKSDKDCDIYETCDMHKCVIPRCDPGKGTKSLRLRHKKFKSQEQRDEYNGNNIEHKIRAL